MCGNTLNRTRAGGAIEIPKGPEKREKATLVYILAAYRVCTELCPFIAIPLLAKAYGKDLALGGLKQGQLQIGRNTFTLIFENMKFVEISTNHFNII